MSEVRMEIKRNSTSLFTNVFTNSDKEKAGNRRSVKMDDGDKNVFAKIYSTVTKRGKANNSILDQSSLEKLDAIIKKKDEEHEVRVKANLSLSPAKDRLGPLSRHSSDSNAKGNNNIDKESFENPRTLKRKDSLTSFPNYTYLKPERKEASAGDIKKETVVGNSNTYRNKRANSENGGADVRKTEGFKPARFDRERSQGHVGIVSSRLPSTLLPALAIEQSKNVARPTSPTLMQRSARERSKLSGKAVTDLQKMKERVNVNVNDSG